jgi:hypothetical protein
MWQVKEEWFIFVLPYKLDGLFGIAFGKGVLIDGRLDDLLVPHQGKGRQSLVAISVSHIVTVGNAEIGIESLTRGEELGLIALVPFSDADTDIPLSFENLRDGPLVRVKPPAITWNNHKATPVALMHTDSERITTCQQAGPRRTAYAAGYIEARKLGSFFSHPIHARSSVLRRSKTSDIAIAHIIHEDDDEVCFPLLSGCI